MNIGIVGSRGVTNEDWVFRKLDKILLPLTVNNIVSGGARGVDTMAKNYANRNNINLIEHKPQYQNYPKGQEWRAPLDRNTTIVEESNLIVAFWDGVSTGTMDSVNKARERGIEVIIENIGS